MEHIMRFNVFFSLCASAIASSKAPFRISNISLMVITFLDGRFQLSLSLSKGPSNLKASLSEGGGPEGVGRSVEGRA